MSEGNKVSGWLIIDKPKGLTSTMVVRKIKKALNVKKIGHAGTLDPLATGVLGVALGEATKTIPYLMNTEKKYDFTLRWGWETTTEDELGVPTLKNARIPDFKEIETALLTFKGRIEQLPPQFSALKVQGKRAYALAREGIVFTLNKRWVTISDLQAFPTKAVEKQAFSVACSKGTYVRSLARDIARSVNAAGHITDLRRTQVGSFSIDHAILLDNFLDYVHTHSIQQAVHSYVQPLHAVLDDIPAAVVSDFQESKLRQGQYVLYEKQDFFEATQILCKNQKNQSIGITRPDIQNEKLWLCPEKIFNI